MLAVERKRSRFHLLLPGPVLPYRLLRRLDRRRSPLPEALPSAVQAADSVEPRCRHQETVRRQRFPDRQDRPLKGALGGSVMELADREFFHNEKVREAAESFLPEKAPVSSRDLSAKNKEKAASLADGETGKVISLIAGKAREEILARMSREEWLQKLLALVGEKAKTAGAKEALAGAIKKAGEEQKQQAGFFKRLLFSAAELTGTVDYEEMAETGLAALGAAMRSAGKSRKILSTRHSWPAGTKLSMLSSMTKKRKTPSKISERASLKNIRQGKR